jgi:hypothetical protein
MTKLNAVAARDHVAPAKRALVAKKRAPAKPSSKSAWTAPR